MEYIVFFQLFGKKMKSPVKASTPEEAIKIVRDKLEIIKVERIPDAQEKTDLDIVKDFLHEFFKKP